MFCQVFEKGVNDFNNRNICIAANLIKQGSHTQKTNINVMNDFLLILQTLRVDG